MALKLTHHPIERSVIVAPGKNVPQLKYACMPRIFFFMWKDYSQCRLTKFYKKNLDDLQDSGAEIDSAPVTTRVYDLEAFGGSIFYYKTVFRRHNIANFDTNNFVFSSATPFVDITFMHHSLQPGEWVLTECVYTWDTYVHVHVHVCAHCVLHKFITPYIVMYVWKFCMNESPSKFPDA